LAEKLSLSPRTETAPVKPYTLVSLNEKSGVVFMRCVWAANGDDAFEDLKLDQTIPKCVHDSLLDDLDADPRWNIIPGQLEVRNF
jgi:hypothetical protein